MERESDIFNAVEVVACPDLRTAGSFKCKRSMKSSGEFSNGAADGLGGVSDVDQSYTPGRARGDEGGVSVGEGGGKDGKVQGGRAEDRRVGVAAGSRNTGRTCQHMGEK